MKSLKLLPLVASGILCVFATSAFATVTLQIRTNGFLDPSGNPPSVKTNDMPWGVVIDTNPGGGLGFGDVVTQFSGWTTGNAIPVNTPMMVSPSDAVRMQLNNLDSEFYFARAQANSSNGGNGPPPTFDDGFFNTIQIDLDTSAIASGNSFALMWFPAAALTAPGGSDFGLLVGSPALLPAEGATTDFSASFDSAGSVFGEVVPEPSSMLLLLTGVGAFGLRRRRSPRQS